MLCRAHLCPRGTVGHQGPRQLAKAPVTPSVGPGAEWVQSPALRMDGGPEAARSLPCLLREAQPWAAGLWAAASRLLVCDMRMIRVTCSRVNAKGCPAPPRPVQGLSASRAETPVGEVCCLSYAALRAGGALGGAWASAVGSSRPPPCSCWSYCWKEGFPGFDRQFDPVSVSQLGRGRLREGAGFRRPLSSDGPSEARSKVLPGQEAGACPEGQKAHLCPGSPAMVSSCHFPHSPRTPCVGGFLNPAPMLPSKPQFG